MRIGCLQVRRRHPSPSFSSQSQLTPPKFAPQVGDIDNNLNRADAVLNKANPQNLDILVLPELAFSGTSFLPAGRACLNFVESSLWCGTEWRDLHGRAW